MTTMRVQTLKACRRVRHAVGSYCIGVARAAPLQARLIRLSVLTTCHALATWISNPPPVSLVILQTVASVVVTRCVNARVA
jgi:hypothetical protein